MYASIGVTVKVWHVITPKIQAPVFYNGPSRIYTGRIGPQLISIQRLYTNTATAGINKSRIICDLDRVVGLGIGMKSEKDVISKVAFGIAPIIGGRRAEIIDNIIIKIICLVSISAFINNSW